MRSQINIYELITKRLGAALLPQCLFQDLVSGIPLEISWAEPLAPVRLSGPEQIYSTTVMPLCSIPKAMTWAQALIHRQCLGKAVLINTAGEKNSLCWPILNKRNLKSLLAASMHIHWSPIECYWQELKVLTQHTGKSMRQTSEVW